MTEDQLFDISIPNESNERFEERKLKYIAREEDTYEDYLSLSGWMDGMVSDEDTSIFIINVDFNEPNVIGMMDRMVNDLRHSKK